LTTTSSSLIGLAKAITKEMIVKTFTLFKNHELFFEAFFKSAGFGK
jgi:hypothetical protein